GVSDLPEIDLLILTHDHFDHLDFTTIAALIPRVKHTLATLGVGSHLEFWGMPTDRITELDWWESFEFSGKIKLTSAPTRHFSGRTFKRNQTLWGSFVLESGKQKIYLGGDSGYGPHFKMIGEKHGPFDLALLECGQYGPNWPLIHMTPEETVLASRELGAKILFPIHWGKFVLSTHAWNDPIKRAAKKAAEENVKLAVPRIGEVLTIAGETRTEAWWE
ncbi:MAG: MBL fold metallo-hydrolase, partial [Spirochaetia bacterium]|nr:MBL fold metallo-hydrolase [Spirochaetia bacterium]